jgi:glycosyltransferase involved in cell wall biosynthesis
MKILHACLAAFYIDGYSYQENILPREHKKNGYEVMIVASTETFLDNNSLGYTKPKSYYTEDGIPIIRLGYSKLLPRIIMKKIRMYKGLKKILNEFKPDIVFMHDLQFLDIRHFASFAKNNPKTRIYVDCHADFSNSAKTWLSKNVLHKIIYRFCAKKIEPFTNVFWGVLPARVDFLIDVYKIQKEKVDLLVMGAEDEKVKDTQNGNSRDKIRKDNHIKPDDFLIITGGKIDSNKPEVLTLMEAVKEINNCSVKLLVFGSIAPNLKDKFDSLLCESIKYVGWINSENIYKYFNAGELVFFPGLHSVLWEQAVGQGKPCVFKYIEGFNHVDLGGNCLFLYDGSINEIKETIIKLTKDNHLYNCMNHVAQNKGLDFFSYNKIAKRSIQEGI